VAGDKAAKEGEQEAHERGRVWVEDADGFVRPLRVRIGASDGLMTEVLGDDLKEEDEVVVGEVRRDQGEKTTNPFTPQAFRGKAKQ
jgi:hypothetical protein